MGKKSLWMILIISLVLLVHSTAFAATYTAADYATLQDALKNAGSGDYIELKKTIVIPAGASIDGKGATVVPASDFTPDGHGAAFACMGDDIAYDASKSYTLKNLTFKGFTGLSRVVRANFSNVTIENCAFENNSVSNGVITSAYAKLTVKNCSFVDNSAGIAIVDLGYDVSTAFAPVSNISGNTFSDNDTDFAIYVLTPGDVTNNSFTGNEVDTAVVFVENSSNVTGNYFSDNTHSGANANAGAIVAGPYKPGSYEINITGNGFDNALSKNGKALPSVYVEDWSEQYKANTDFDLSKNYWDGKEPEYASSGNPNVTLNGYYDTLSINNGKLALSNTKPVTKVMPSTGDASQIWMWMALCMASFAGMLTLAVQGKKNNA